MKKPSLAEAVASEPDDDEDDDLGMDDEEVAYGDVADEVFAALKSGNKAAFRTALKAAIKSC